MKLNINFLQTSGVPLTNDLMATIMEAIKFHDVLGDIVGHLTIVSGGDLVAGSTTVVNPGVVAINGELLPFEGGTIYPNVFIHTQDFTETFEDQTNKVLVQKKMVKFGDSPVVFPWTGFLKLQTLREMQISLDGKADQSDLDDVIERLEVVELKTAPIINGGIVWIWNLPVVDIPVGWKECTDLRGKTVFGRNPDDDTFSDLGNTGGNKSIIQTLEQMPIHSHTYTRTLPWSGGGGGFDGGGNPFSITGAQTTEQGGNQAMNILNPYRIVNFIEPNFQ
ncbi:MAG: hypothetical protein RR411_01255 [Chryseobacterium sp.]|uniref:hypothetical protein n=2 Tax=Chryseobacterium sp. TaxID=1871047 RepID=UPI002FCAD484